MFYLRVNEVHLINSWGLSFRPAFTLIGTFLRGRFPSSISIMGLSDGDFATWFTNRVCLQEPWLL